MDLRKQVESVQVGIPVRKIKESSLAETPEVIFTEIRAITANWITRNNTFYPKKELVGKAEEGTGAISFYYPYPVPVLKDHASAGGFFGGEVSPPFGRVYNAQFVNEHRSGGGWVKAIAAITDKDAIEKILTGRWLTVSIGSSVDSVTCSICKRDLVKEGLCDHYKGQTYDGDLCHWILGGIRMDEISFVNVPSDVNAGVVNPTLPESEARVLLGGSKGEFLLDMATESKIPVESYREQVLGVSKRTYQRILEGCEVSLTPEDLKSFRGRIRKLQ